MEFDLFSPPRILFGRGTLDRIGEIAAGMGRRAFVVRGGRHLDASRTMGRLESLLGDRGVSCVPFTVRGEPGIDLVDGAHEEARRAGSDLVVGIGGGSALDAAKAVAALLANGGRALDYLEVVGPGKALEMPAAPLVAIPTTAGTGTEATRNAVLTSRSHGAKASMRSHHLVPRVAIVDPALADTLPRRVTAATGLDALTQLIEAYVTRRANPVTDSLAIAGIRIAARSLRPACDSDPAGRDGMALASLLGGLCLANSGLGAVHGIAAPLGAMAPIPHGVACAGLLPHVMEANKDALRASDPASPVLSRYADIELALAPDSAARLVADLGIPPLSSFGLGEDRIEEIAARASASSSMKGNPVPLPHETIVSIIRRAL